MVLHTSISVSPTAHTDSKRSLTMNLHGYIFIALLFLLGASASAQSMQPGYIYTYAGNGLQNFIADGNIDNGSAALSEFNYPSQLTFDPSGNLYVVDTDDNVIRKITPGASPGVSPGGIVSTFAGVGRSGLGNGEGDGGPATGSPIYTRGGYNGIVSDSNGNIYFTDSTRIRMVNTQGIISTFVNLGANSVYTLAIDSANNLYFGTANSIQKVTQQGVVSTIAGSTTSNTGACSPEGSAPNVQIGQVVAMALDSNNNLYFSQDSCFNVFKLDLTNGTISNFAGTGITGFSGDGGPAVNAKLSGIFEIVVDHNNNVYLADSQNNQRIRIINSAGIINTFAGTGAVVQLGGAYNGDNIPATSANLSFVYGLAFDASGNLYLGDSDTFRIREIYQ